MPEFLRWMRKTVISTLTLGSLWCLSCSASSITCEEHNPGSGHLTGVRYLSDQEEAALFRYLTIRSKSEICFDYSIADLDKDNPSYLQVAYLSNPTKVTKRLCRATYHLGDAYFQDGQIRQYHGQLGSPIIEKNEQVTSHQPSHYYWISKSVCRLQDALSGVGTYRLKEEGYKAEDIEYMVENSARYAPLASGCNAIGSSPKLALITRVGDQYLLAFPDGRRVNEPGPNYCSARVEVGNVK